MSAAIAAGGPDPQAGLTPAQQDSLARALAIFQPEPAGLSLANPADRGWTLTKNVAGVPVVLPNRFAAPIGDVDVVHGVYAGDAAPGPGGSWTFAGWRAVAREDITVGGVLTTMVRRSGTQASGSGDPDGHRPSHIERQIGEIEYTPLAGAKMFRVRGLSDTTDLTPVDRHGRFDEQTVDHVDRFEIGSGPVPISMTSLDLTTAITGLDLAMQTSMMQAQYDMGQTYGRASTRALTPAQRAAADRFVEAIAGLLRSATFSGSGRNLRLTPAHSRNTEIARFGFRFTIGAHAPATFSASFGFTADGLAIGPADGTAIVAGASDPSAFGALPLHNLIASFRVDDAPTAATIALFRVALEHPEAAGRIAPRDDAGPSGPPLRLTLDALGFDLGRVLIGVTGTVLLPPAHPERATRVADATAARPDAAIGAVTAPEHADTKRALVALRGYGRTEGDVTRWHIDARQGSVRVNGVELRLPGRTLPR